MVPNKPASIVAHSDHRHSVPPCPNSGLQTTRVLVAPPIAIDVKLFFSRRLTRIPEMERCKITKFYGKRQLW